jgi:hypothetical protein
VFDTGAWYDLPPIAPQAVVTANFLASFLADHIDHRLALSSEVTTVVRAIVELYNPPTPKDLAERRRPSEEASPELGYPYRWSFAVDKSTGAAAVKNVVKQFLNDTTPLTTNWLYRRWEQGFLQGQGQRRSAVSEPRQTSTASQRVTRRASQLKREDSRGTSTSQVESEQDLFVIRPLHRPASDSDLHKLVPAFRKFSVSVPPDPEFDTPVHSPMAQEQSQHIPLPAIQPEEQSVIASIEVPEPRQDTQPVAQLSPAVRPAHVRQGSLEQARQRLREHQDQEAREAASIPTTAVLPSVPEDAGTPHTQRSDAKALNEGLLYGRQPPSVSLPKQPDMPAHQAAATVVGVSDESTATERGSLNSFNLKRGTRTKGRGRGVFPRPHVPGSPEYKGPGTIRPAQALPTTRISAFRTPPPTDPNMRFPEGHGQHVEASSSQNKGKEPAAPLHDPSAPLNEIREKFDFMESVMEAQRREISQGVAQMNATLTELLHAMQRPQASQSHQEPPQPAPQPQAMAPNAPPHPSPAYPMTSQEGPTATHLSAGQTAQATHLSAGQTTQATHLPAGFPDSRDHSGMTAYHSGNSANSQYSTGQQRDQPHQPQATYVQPLPQHAQPGGQPMYQAPVNQHANGQPQTQLPINLAPAPPPGMYTRFSPRPDTAPPQQQQQAQQYPVQQAHGPTPQASYGSGDARRYANTFPTNAGQPPINVGQLPSNTGQFQTSDGQPGREYSYPTNPVGATMNQPGVQQGVNPAFGGYQAQYHSQVYPQQTSVPHARDPMVSAPTQPRPSAPLFQQSMPLPTPPAYGIPGQYNPNNVPNAHGGQTVMGTPQNLAQPYQTVLNQCGNQPQFQAAQPTPAQWTMAQPLLPQDVRFTPQGQVPPPTQAQAPMAAPVLQACGDGYLTTFPTEEEIKTECERAKAMGGGDFRFNPKDIGYFNPGGKNFDENGINVYQGKTTYKHVRSFLEAVQAATTILPDYIVRAHLWKCLEGEALTWFQHQLPQGGKQFAMAGRGLENWTKLLTDKFARPKSEVGAELAKMMFTRADLLAGKSITTFAVNVARNLQEWGYADPVRDERFWMDHIYSKLDARFRINIADPTEDPNMRYDKFIQLLESRAKIWREEQGPQMRGGYNSQYERPGYYAGQGQQSARPRGYGVNAPRPTQQTRSSFAPLYSRPNAQQPQPQGSANAPPARAFAQPVAGTRNDQGQFTSQSQQQRDQYQPRQYRNDAPNARGGGGGRDRARPTYVVTDQEGYVDEYPDGHAPPEEYDGGDEDDHEDAFYNNPSYENNEQYDDQVDQATPPLRMPGYDAQGTNPVAFVEIANAKPSFVGFGDIYDNAGPAPRTCGTCAEQFQSNNKLWNHIRATGHFVRADDRDDGEDPTSTKNRWASCHA